MKGLLKFEHEKVKLVTVDKEVYFGYVYAYIPPDENEDGIESIILEINKEKLSIEFKANEIKTIELV